MDTENDKLRHALQKRASGRGLKNSELTALRKFDRAEILASKPLSPTKTPEADTRTGPTSGRDTLFQETPATPPASYSEGTAVEVVRGSDGKLIKVVTHSTATMPTAFPTVLETLISNMKVRLGGVTEGILIQKLGTNYVLMSDTNIQVIYGDGGGVSIVKDEGIHIFNSSGKDCFIANAAVTHDMSVREIDVCAGGVAKKMLVLASAPY